MRITVESRIAATPRALQAASLFDLDVGGFSRLTWDAELPLADKPWHVGLITGPSGCGKSTVARRLFADARWLDTLPPWPADRSVIDGFPEPMSVKEITALLAAVGFSSPPAWLRPYPVLSTGQKFRADLARLLAHAGPDQLTVCDEFTSVVDRTVAKVGSAAVAKAVRARNLRFVAVYCHEDVIDWLQPDWVYRPDANSFAWRSLQRRPNVDLEIVRTTAAAWPLFASHHYLSHALNASAVCFLATVTLPGRDPTPAAFSAWLPFLGKGPPARRGLPRKQLHRAAYFPPFKKGTSTRSTSLPWWPRRNQGARNLLATIGSTNWQLCVG